MQTLKIYNIQYRIINNRKGFTLLEVLIAVAILSIGLLTLAGMQGTAIRGNSVSNDMTVAIQLAEEMVERIRVNGGSDPGIYDGIDTNNTCSGTDPALGDCIQWQTRFQNSMIQNIRGTVTVSQNDDPVNKSRTITVTITWGTSPANKTITFTTIMETWIT